MRFVQQASRKNAFASFIAADTLFGCAEDIIVVATGWLIYSKTKSTFALGMIGLAGFMPLIMLSLLTGMATDRFDRRRVLAFPGPSSASVHSRLVGRPISTPSGRFISSLSSSVRGKPSSVR